MSIKKEKIDNEIIAFSLFNAIIFSFSPENIAKYEIVNINITDICYSISLTLKSSIIKRKRNYEIRNKENSKIKNKIKNNKIRNNKIRNYKRKISIFLYIIN